MTTDEAPRGVGREHDEPRVVLGVVAAPGPAFDLARQHLGDQSFATGLGTRLAGAEWEVELVENRLVTPPADDGEIVAAARELMLTRGWDVVLGVTDLPLHERRRPVLAHASPLHGVAVISIPALGPRGRGRRLNDIAAELLARLLGQDAGAADGELTRRVRELGTDTEPGASAFTARVLTGNLRLITGMVRANQPWRLTLRLSRALAAAAAAGVFALITSDIWRMADTFGAVRSTLAMIGSIIAIAATLVIGAELWERAPGRRMREQVALFNIATVATVLIGVGAFYLALFGLAVLAAAFLVVPSGFADALGHPVGIGDYLELAWLTCSLATVGGALGAGLEDDDTVREAAYARHSDAGAE
ncbi:hypothetical protein AB0H71_06210 [Nocardia sp. NPDC050697]|uniref:hypothetical protein n=1 Tax=Nocardia sp. NPDC050697 TaxID=3155158 RepID=UPI00340076A2